MLLNAFVLLVTFIQVNVYAETVAAKRNGGLVVGLNYATFEGASTDGVDSFLGIPYARPPVGDLRFRRPKPPLPFPGTTLVSDLAHSRALLPIAQWATLGNSLWKRLFATELYLTLHSGPQLYCVGPIRFECQCI